MNTAQELIDLLRSSGMDGGDLAALLMRKAADSILAKLAGATRAVGQRFVSQFQRWHEHHKLQSDLETCASEQREELVRKHLERWMREQKASADEIARLLFRIVYLRALRTQCGTVSIVGNINFTQQRLDEVWISVIKNKDALRSLILDGLALRTADLAGHSRAAEVLHDFEYTADARNILFSASEKVLGLPEVDPHDMLWLADAMVYCDLPWSAKNVLRRAEIMRLDKDSSARFLEIQKAVREFVEIAHPSN